MASKKGNLPSPSPLFRLFCFSVGQFSISLATASQSLMYWLKHCDCRFGEDLKDFRLKMARYIHPKFRLVGLYPHERKEAIDMVKVSVFHHLVG